MPILAAPELTEAAIADLLAQSVPTRLLLVNQGVDDAFRTRLERIAEQEAERVFLWNHMPPLPSLSATWNRALEFVWAVGSEEALVVNNDLRLHRQTVEYLRRILQREHALFVSAVGVTAEQFDSARVYSDYDFFDAHSDREDAGFLLSRGGPDFSCSLISRACHERQIQLETGDIERRRRHRQQDVPIGDARHASHRQKEIRERPVNDLDALRPSRRS